MNIPSRIALIHLFVLAFFSPGSSQTSLPDSSAADTLGVKFIAPIPGIGTLDRSVGPEYLITDSTINFSNYRYAADLLQRTPGVFIRDFSNLGTLPDLTISGLSGREIAFMVDGVQLNDPISGVFNPYLYPTENIGQIEVILGTRAFLYGRNSTGGAINVITKSKKAIKPYSRLRYSESGYGFGIVDGMVSQDILRGLNVTAGTQHSVFGERYPNENYDCWNARVKVRYNIDDRVNIFASEMYNQSLLGMYGGVDMSATPDSLRFESLQAIVRNTDAYEKIARHDLQAGAAMRLLPDSASVTTAILYFTTNVRRYRDLENRPLSNGIYFDRSFLTRWFGLKLTQNLTLGTQRFDFGADIGSQRILVTPAARESLATLMSVHGITRLPISSLFQIAAYGRADQHQAGLLLGYGADAVVTPDQSFEIFGGYSRSYRIPVYEELTGATPFLVRLPGDDPERHHLFEVGFRWNDDDGIALEVRSFHRTVWNAISADSRGSSAIADSEYGFTRHEKKILQGAAASGSIRFGSFCLEGAGQFLEIIDHAESERTLPCWSANGGIYFRDKILNDHLDLNIGICGKYFSVYTGREFDERTQIYFSGGQSSVIAPAGIVDAVILAHIGGAYIHLIWENVLNRQYIMNSFYPMPERQMRFGVSWEFLD